MLKTLLQRLREPSTMAGIAAIAMVFGVPAGASEAVMQVIGGVAGLAAVLLPENKGQ